MRPSVDFSFDDRVARRYDHQRAHPNEVSRLIGEAIADVVGQGKRLLEIGVGTARIAKPVAQAGVDVVGFDLSANMLHEIGDDLPSNLHTFRADMRQYPFRSDSFDGVMAVHVLHLVKDWPGVLAEAARVMVPGGVFIQGDDWIAPDSVIGGLRDELRRIAVELLPAMMPPGAGVSRQQVLQNLGGGAFEEIVAAEWTTQISPAERLAAYQSRTDNESWILNDEMFAEAFPRLVSYAQEKWGDLDAPQPVQRRFVLKVSRGDWHSG
jgi:ubiquinone/menaquinone biosynthesis C-methylase UbiE